MGVRRAVELAEAEAKNSSPVYTFGPIVHNPKVLSDLKKNDVKVINESASLDGATVVIRAHGISPGVENELRSGGARIVDATCPNVKASQLKAEELARVGYYLFIAGEANHAEVEGIVGYVQNCDGLSSVVGSAQEAGKAAKNLYSINSDTKTALLGQTTISEEEYRVIGEAVGMFFPNLEIIQTICAATKERQLALRELLDHVDAVIIAGGKESANTNRLFSIAKASGKPCALVESKEEIPQNFYNYEKVGLCAGASTPDSVIDEIESSLNV
jgi:4-hydroxy-3-methylbut-2-enyl diphosphate reductase